MLASILFGMMAGALLTLLLMAMLDLFHIWHNPVGEWTWKIWEIIFPFLFLLGIIEWWIVPWFGGPFWGRVIALWMSITFIFLVHYRVQKYRGKV